MEQKYVTVLCIPLVTSALCVGLQLYTVRQKNGTTFLSWISLLIHSVIWQNLALLLLVNIIIDVTFSVSGIYTNFRRLLRKKSVT